MFKFIVSILILVSTKLVAQDTISASQAKDFMDKTIFVKGKVISYRAAKDGKTTNYINIDKPYPDAAFTVVLTNSYLAEKSLKIEDLDQKIICVVGKITTYKNDPKQTPQIFNPDKIIIVK